jgi:putative sigma-54 modulation protein
MKINIQSPGFTIKADLAGYVQEKVENLSRYNSEIITGEVCLSLEISATKENKLCEIRLAIPGNDLLARAQCKTFEEAVSDAVEIIKRRIKRKKTKLIRNRNANITNISI